MRVSCVHLHNKIIIRSAIDTRRFKLILLYAHWAHSQCVFFLLLLSFFNCSHYIQDAYLTRIYVGRLLPAELLKCYFHTSYDARHYAHITHTCMRLSYENKIKCIIINVSCNYSTVISFICSLPQGIGQCVILTHIRSNSHSSKSTTTTEMK